MDLTKSPHWDYSVTQLTGLHRESGNAALALNIDIPPYHCAFGILHRQRIFSKMAGMLACGSRVTRVSSPLIRYWKNQLVISIGNIVVNFTLFTLLNVGKISIK